MNAGSADVFPAVPGMVDLEQKALAKGYQVFFLTGRPATQLTGTLANLRDAGYTVDDSHVFLKDLTASYLQPCQTDANNLPCTTTEYKSLTRKHIEEDLGYDLVANFGDQYSDLARRLRGPGVQDPEPDVLPALTHRTTRCPGTPRSRGIRLWSPTM